VSEQVVGCQYSCVNMAGSGNMDKLTTWSRIINSNSCKAVWLHNKVLQHNNLDGVII